MPVWLVLEPYHPHSPPPPPPSSGKNSMWAHFESQEIIWNQRWCRKFFQGNLSSVRTWLMSFWPDGGWAESHEAKLLTGVFQRPHNFLHEKGRSTLDGGSATPRQVWPQRLARPIEVSPRSPMGPSIRWSGPFPVEPRWQNQTFLPSIRNPKMRSYCRANKPSSFNHSFTWHCFKLSRSCYSLCYPISVYVFSKIQWPEFKSVPLVRSKQHTGQWPLVWTLKYLCVAWEGSSC